MERLRANEVRQPDGNHRTLRIRFVESEGDEWRGATGLLTARMDSDIGTGGAVEARSPEPDRSDGIERGRPQGDQARSAQAALRPRFRQLRRALRAQAWDECIEEYKRIYELLLQFDLRADGLLGWLGLIHAAAQLEKGWGSRFRSSLATVLWHTRRLRETEMARFAREFAAVYRRESVGRDGRPDVGCASGPSAVGRLSPSETLRRRARSSERAGEGSVPPASGGVVLRAAQSRSGRYRGWPGLLRLSSLGGPMDDGWTSPEGTGVSADVDYARDWVDVLARLSPSEVPGAWLVAASRAVIRNVGDLDDEDRRRLHDDLDVLAMKARGAWARAALLAALAEVALWRVGSGPMSAARSLARARSDFGLASGIYHRLGLEVWAHAAEERSEALGCVLRAQRAKAGGIPRDGEGGRGASPGTRPDPRQSRPTVRGMRRRAAAQGFLTGDQVTLEEIARLALLAPSPLPVLVDGETGTGKEVLARAIHEWSRVPGELVPIHCGAIPRELLESELFGHARGAFTGASGEKPGLFELANHGTLFLDEIGEMSADTQMKMLRVLENGEVRRVGDVRTRRVSVRIVAATHRDLEALVESNGFRRDLFHRIASVRVRIPPLRDRRADLPLLVGHLLSSVDAGLRIEADALAVVMAYPWPGNVRELRNTLLRAAYMARALGHRTIRADMLGLRTGDGDGMAIDSRPDAPTPSSGGFAHAFSDMMLLPEDDPSAAIPDTSEPGPRFRLQEEIARLEGLPLVEGAGLGEALDILERRLIVRALEENAWNRTKAAASLGGLSRTTLIGKMKRLGIEVMGPIGTEPTRA